MFSLVSTLVIECLLMDKGGLWRNLYGLSLGTETSRAMEKNGHHYTAEELYMLKIVSANLGI